MKTLPVLLILLAASPVSAQDAGAPQKLDAPFTWSAADLQVIDAGEGWKVAHGSSEIVFTGTNGTPFDTLVGHCLMLSRFKADTPDYQAQGHCAFSDADGDRIFESFEETNGRGKGVMKDGTGKLAGTLAEYEYEGAWHGSPGPDRNAGIGRKVGTWRKTGS